MLNKNTRLLNTGLRLEYMTLGWNVVGAAIVGVAAWQAGSGAMVGFGLDSLIEIGASTVVIWQLRGVGADRQRAALRLIAVAFFALAAYVLAQSAWTLATGRRAGVTTLGIVWLVLTVAAMLALAAGKGRVGNLLANPVLRAEARVTLVDAYLAASVLVGLLLNAAVGWWWTDPLAALIIVFYGVREGFHALAESRERRPVPANVALGMPWPQNFTD